MVRGEYGIAALFANVPRFFPNVPQFGETRHIFTGKAALYKTAHFQEVRCTRRDKCGTRYTALISTTVARLLHPF